MNFLNWTRMSIINYFETESVVTISEHAAFFVDRWQFPIMMRRGFY